MRMNLRRHVVWMLLAVVAMTVVESSLLVQRSLLRPRLPEPCFTSRAGDRPFAYPLISFLSKIKGMFVRGLNVLVATSKEHKLASKL